MTNPQRPPAVYPNYPAADWQYIVDKTGTVFQTVNGRLVPNGAWGVYVFRCPPNAKPEQVYFLQDGHGTLTVDGKRLVLLATDKNWQMFIIEIKGYVAPPDCPDSDVVDINEVQLATLRQSIATAQAQASQAYAMAQTATNRCNDLSTQVVNQQKQINELTQRVNALLTPSQVNDLVWQKLKDMNYLYRLAFLAWPKPDPDADIRAYVDDLVALIRKAK